MSVRPADHAFEGPEQGIGANPVSLHLYRVLLVKACRPSYIALAKIDSPAN